MLRQQSRAIVESDVDARRVVRVEGFQPLFCRFGQFGALFESLDGEPLVTLQTPE